MLPEFTNTPQSLVVREVKFCDELHDPEISVKPFREQVESLTNLLNQRIERCSTLLSYRDLVNVGKSSLELLLTDNVDTAVRNRSLRFLFDIVLPGIQLAIAKECYGDKPTTTQVEFINSKTVLDAMYLDIAMLRNIPELNIYSNIWLANAAMRDKKGLPRYFSYVFSQFNGRGSQFAQDLWKAHKDIEIFPSNRLYREYD